MMLPRLFILLVTLITASPVFAHQNASETNLLVHFATGTRPLESGRWPDLIGRANAWVVGEPFLTNRGPAEALVLDGFTDHLLIATNAALARPLLPSRNMSVTAWVLLEETRPTGGIVGFVQDDGNLEKGWVLGYGRRSFQFDLSSVGADDGNGRSTRISGKTAIELGRWHHVAGTYDGETMRLYVDGRQEAESVVQSGAILYPDEGRFAVGAFVDPNELFPMEGAVYEVKVYDRVLSADEIGSVVRRNASLLAWRPPVNRELSFLVPPYLQRATSNGITVMAETERPVSLVVEYAERQPLRSRAQSLSRSTINLVRLEGLKPSTTYFYRVTATDASNHIARSDVLSFQTLPGPSAAWAFGVLGDTQRNPEITRRCAEGLFALRPHAVIHCGDVVDDGFAKPQWVNDLMVPCNRLFSQVPVFPVIGNHEKNAHWYYDYFDLPDPEYWYTWKIGNAQFFMIDSNKDCGPGSEQYRWLERELKASTATWKFTVHHHPCFSSDEDDYGDRLRGRPDRRWTEGDSNAARLVPLYEKYGVDVAFAGHIHSYERTWPILQMSINQRRGVRYIVSGGGGGNLEQAAPQRAWFSLHVHRGHHYGFAVVQDRAIQFKAYDVDGRLFDTFELIKPEDR
jgi:hypothetical protein